MGTIEGANTYVSPRLAAAEKAAPHADEQQHEAVLLVCVDNIESCSLYSPYLQPKQDELIGMDGMRSMFLRMRLALVSIFVMCFKNTANKPTGMLIG
jgi:hypothetical protein